MYSIIRRRCLRCNELLLFGASWRCAATFRQADPALLSLAARASASEKLRRSCRLIALKCVRRGGDARYTSSPRVSGGWPSRIAPSFTFWKATPQPGELPRFAAGRKGFACRRCCADPFTERIAGNADSARLLSLTPVASLLKLHASGDFYRY